jgi:hypothetical protein
MSSLITTNTEQKIKLETNFRLCRIELLRRVPPEILSQCIGQQLAVAHGAVGDKNCLGLAPSVEKSMLPVAEKTDFLPLSGPHDTP